MRLDGLDGVVVEVVGGGGGGRRVGASGCGEWRSGEIWWSGEFGQSAEAL